MGASGLVVSGCDVDADGHDTGPHHPERKARLVAVREGIRDAGFGDVDPLPRRLATREELLRVHSAAYLDALEQFCAAGGGALDPDTIVSRGTWDTALAAAGAGLAAIDALAAGSGDAAFVGSRPPGHHADRTRAIGLSPGYALAWAARGNAYLILGRFDEALADLTQAEKLEPNNEDTKRVRELAQKKVDEMVQQAKVVELAPETGKVSLPGVPEAAAPKPEAPSPKPEASAPKPEVTAPKPEVTGPKSEVTAPKSEVTAPKTEVTARIPQVSGRKPAVSAPKGFTLPNT